MVYPHSYRTQNSETRTTSSDYGDYYAKITGTKIRVPPELKVVLQYIDASREEMLQDFQDFVAIPSISGIKDHYSDMIRMLKKVECWFKKLNIKYESFDLGKGDNDLDGKLPPVILAEYIVNKNKLTICIYTHIDITYTNPTDWKTKCPYKLNTDKTHVYGAGVACGKGPLLMWLHAIQAYQETSTELPVNIKFIVDSMYGIKHPKLERFLRKHLLGFFKDCDHWVVNTTTWLGNVIPCLSYGTTGLAHYKLSAEQAIPETDVKNDLVALCKTIGNDEGTILVPELKRWVQQITPDEEITYQNIRDFDEDAIREILPEHKKGWDKIKLLMNFWRLPSIQITEIEECLCERKRCFPKKVQCLLLLKIVPYQVPEQKTKVLQEHIDQFVKQSAVQSKFTLEPLHGVRPWLARTDSEQYVAARRAIIQIYKETPNMIREDETVPIVPILDSVFKRPIILLPLCARSSNIGQPNENITKRSFFEGTKLLCAYMLQYVHIKKLIDI